MLRYDKYTKTNLFSRRYQSSLVPIPWFLQQENQLNIQKQKAQTFLKISLIKRGFYIHSVRHLNVSFSINILSTHICLECIIGLVGRVFANGPGDLGSITGRVISKILKWYLIPPRLTLSNIRYVSRVKWSNPGKRVAPSPTPWWSSYWKGSHQVTVDYSRPTLLYFINIIY